MPERIRSTFNLDSRIHHALKLKAAATGQKMSEIVNAALTTALSEDFEDLHAVEERANETERPFEDYLNELEADGLI